MKIEQFSETFPMCECHNIVEDTIKGLTDQEEVIQLTPRNYEGAKSLIDFEEIAVLETMNEEQLSKLNPMSVQIININNDGPVDQEETIPQFINNQVIGVTNLEIVTIVKETMNNEQLSELNPMCVQEPTKLTPEGTNDVVYHKISNAEFLRRKAAALKLKIDNERDSFFLAKRAQSFAKKEQELSKNKTKLIPLTKEDPFTKPSKEGKKVIMSKKTSKLNDIKVKTDEFDFDFDVKPIHKNQEDDIDLCFTNNKLEEMVPIFRIDDSNSQLAFAELTNEEIVIKEAIERTGIPLYKNAGSAQQVFQALQHRKFGSPQDVEDLKRLGYPPEILDIVFERLHKKLEKPAKYINKNNVAGGFKASYNIGEVSKDWIVPHVSIAANLLKTQKPTEYNIKTFKLWVHCQQNILQKKINKKTSFVTGNDIARSMYYGMEFVKKDAMIKALHAASIYIADYNDEKNVVKTGKETNLPLLAYLDVKDLNKALGDERFADFGSFVSSTNVDCKFIPLGGIILNNLKDLQDYEWCFKGHRNVYKKCELYFHNDPSIDLVKIVKILNDKVVPQMNVPKMAFEGTVSSTPAKEYGLMQGRVLLEIPQLDNITDTVDGFTRAVKAILPGSLIQFTALAVKISSYIYVVTKLDKPDLIFASTIGFLSSFPALGGILQQLIVTFTKTFIKFEGEASDNTNFSKSYMDAIVTSSVYAAVTSIFSEVTSSISALIPDLVKSVRASLIIESGKSIAQQIIDHVKAVFNKIKMAVEEGNYKLLFCEEDPVRWASDAQGFVEHFAVLTTCGKLDESKIETLRKENLISKTIMHQLTLPEYFVLVKDHLATGERIMKLFSFNGKLMLNLRRVHEKLRAFYAQNFCMSLVGGERIVPFSIYFFGKPGVGKSNIATNLIKAVGNVNKYDNENGLYKWNLNVNFQELNQQTWAVLMDDIDIGVAPCAAGVPNHVEEVMRLVNNTKYSVEQAAVDKKGLIFSNPALVVYCSNFFNGNAQNYTRETVAFYRRFNYHVEVSVKKEYATATGQLDKDKAASSSTLDMFIFRVSVPSGLSSPPWTFERDFQYTDFFRFVNDQFKIHQRKGVALLRRNLGASCQYCGITLGKCSCSKEPYPIHTLKTKYVSPPSVTTSVTGDTSVYSDPSYTGDAYAYQELISTLEGSVPTKSKRCNEDKEEELSVVSEPGPATHLLGPFYRVPIPRRTYVRPLSIDEEEESVEMALVDADGESISDTMTYLSFASANALKTRIEMEEEELVKGTKRLVVDDWNSKVQYYAKYTGVAIAIVGVISFTVGFISQQCKKTEEGREGNASGILPANWVRTDQTYTPGLPPKFTHTTWDYKQLTDAIRKCDVNVTNDETKQSMHAMVVSHTLMVAPSHLGKYGETLSFVIGMKRIKVTLNPFNCLPFVNPQLMLIKCNEIPHSGALLPYIMQVDDLSIQSFDEVHIFGSDKHYQARTNEMMKYQGQRQIATNYVTSPGDCGMLYIARHTNAWRVVGMHFSKFDYALSGQTYSVGALLTIQEILALGSRLNVTFQGINVHETTMTKIPERFGMTRMGPKSEVWAAMSIPSTNLAVYGTMCPQLGNASIKTKVIRSMLSHHPEVVEKEKEICGESPYWLPPNFRGSMDFEENVWSSPWTKTFDTTNNTQFDEFYMRVALMDYLHGIEKLDRQGYAKLSDDQTIRGVPGSYVNSVQMNTSVGPPDNCSKREKLSYDCDCSYMHPDIERMIKEIELDLANNIIPSVCGLCVLKDEAVKPNKNPRVFCCLPYALNFVMKKNGAAWKSFTRANFSFFESAVGINMTSGDCNLILNHLRTVDPKLENVYDGDIKRIDKSWSGGLYEFVALIIYAISFSIGVSPNENYLLVHALKHTKYSIKNDLFNVCWNPSGNDWTVELNSILVCLCERYAYYRMYGFDGNTQDVNDYYENFFKNPVPSPNNKHLTFRQNVALVVYGDDNIKSSSLDVLPNYTQIWRDEIGMIMTDAAKSDIMTKGPITSKQFLKRSFVYDEEIGCFKPPLDEKSLIRMLLIKKDSILTQPDHACTVINEYLRERVYYGREKYKEELAFCKRLIEYYKLQHNPILVLKDYEFWLDQMKNDTFQTWSIRSNVETPELLTQINMKINQLAEEENVSSISFTYESTLSMGPVTIAAEDLETTATPATSLQFQDKPNAPLAEFLQRPVKVAEFTLMDTDVLGNMARFDPYVAYTQDARVLEKTKYFEYIKGSMQVTAVLTAPAGCYGLYYLCAMPLGGTVEALNVLSILKVENCMQVDNYVALDISSSTNAVIQLNWIYPYDFARLLDFTTTTNLIYTINLICLSSVKSGIPGGYTQAKLTLFANFMDDVELLAPTYEGKKEVVANDALKSIAPSLHSKISDGKGSAMMKSISAAAGKASNIPFIGDSAKVLSTATAAVGEVMSWFGFTRENNERTPLTITQKSVTNVAHVDGQDSSELASFLVDETINIDPALSGFPGNDCLSYPDLFERWTLVKRIPWTTTQLAGVTIGTVPVTPFFCRGSNTTLQMTTAGYTGLPFTYWHGGMEYLLIIPVSKFHRGAIQVFWSPEHAFAVPGDPTNITFNVIIDVSAQQNNQINIGYFKSQPYIPCSIIRDGYPLSLDTNGTLGFRVINPIVAQNETTTDIFVFARAAEDMDFFLPRSTFDIYNTVSAAYETKEISMGITLEGALGDGKVETNVVDLVHSTHTYPGDQIITGEKVRSIRALLQKPYQLVTINPALEDNTFRFRQFLSPPVAGANPTTFVNFYRCMFLGFAASERFKLFPSTDCWLGMSREVQGKNVKIPTLAPMTFCGPNKGAEFLLPYYNPRKYITQILADTYIDQPYHTSRLDIAKYTAAADLRVVVYYSMGPDIRATMFKQVPRIALTTNVSTIKWFK